MTDQPRIESARVVGWVMLCGDSMETDGMANTLTEGRTDPTEALSPRFKQQAMAVRGLIRNANVHRAFAAARMAPERLERILDELRKQGPLDGDIDRMTSELVHAIEGLDGAIYGPGLVGEDRETKVGAARAAANRKLDELISRLPPN